MDTVIYFSLSFVYVLLLVFGIGVAIKKRWSLYSSFLLLVIAALFYDNSILALGRFIGEGKILEALNVPRYWLHVTLTPLLIPFAWQTVRAAGVSWAKKPWAAYLIIFLTGSIILIEAIPLFDLTLQAEWHHGILSYERVGDSGGGLMIGTVTLSILVASIILWRKQGWKWLFVGLILMGVVGGLSALIESKAVGNISELVLILSLFATQLFLTRVK